MTKALIVFAGVLGALSLAALSSMASEPGQPLDGEDWVFLLPGLTGSDFLPAQVGRCNDLPQNEKVASDVCMWKRGGNVDAEGHVFLLGGETVLTGVLCGGYQLRRQEIYRVTPTGVRQLVAYLDDRCVNPGTSSADRWLWMLDGWEDGNSVDARFSLDPTIGTLRFRMRTQCASCPIAQTQDKIVQMSGFITLLEVAQSFEPVAGNLAFRVPAMPEGLPAADFFDTYWGDLSTVGDWSQARGLQCDYPAEIPSIGDYLTVADTLPTPSPGNGYYYVTAVTHQGETRYGRKRIEGVTSGRDPAALPGCE
jgi:hypothetical protein